MTFHAIYADNQPVMKKNLLSCMENVILVITSTWISWRHWYKKSV